MAFNQRTATIYGHTGEVACQVNPSNPKDSNWEYGIITSGGGFSRVFAGDEWAGWQTKYTKPYLDHIEKLSPNTKNTHGTGRGLPDISSAANNLLVYIGGEPKVLGGTSGSSPTIAAIASLAIESGTRLAPRLLTATHCTPSTNQTPPLSTRLARRLTNCCTCDH